MDQLLRCKIFSHYHKQAARERPIELPPRIEQFYSTTATPPRTSEPHSGEDDDGGGGGSDGERVAMRRSSSLFSSSTCVDPASSSTGEGHGLTSSSSGSERGVFGARCVTASTHVIHVDGPVMSSTECDGGAAPLPCAAVTRRDTTTTTVVTEHHTSRSGGRAPRGEMLDLYAQSPEARAELRRRRKEQLRAQLNHPEAPVVVQLAESDTALCTLGTPLSQYVNGVLALRAQQYRRGAPDLTQTGTVVYATSPLPTPSTPSDAGSEPSVSRTRRETKGKTSAVCGVHGGRARNGSTLAECYNGFYAKYPRSGTKAGRRPTQMCPLYHHAAPVTFEELRQHPLLLTKERRQARWAHRRVPSEDVYGEPVAYAAANESGGVHESGKADAAAGCSCATLPPLYDVSACGTRPSTWHDPTASVSQQSVAGVPNLYSASCVAPYATFAMQHKPTAAAMSQVEGNAAGCACSWSTLSVNIPPPFTSYGLPVMHPTGSATSYNAAHVPPNLCYTPGAYPIYLTAQSAATPWS